MSAPKFEVGDRVRITERYNDEPNAPKPFEVGDEFTITEVIQSDLRPELGSHFYTGNGAIEVPGILKAVFRARGVSEDKLNKLYDPGVWEVYLELVP